MKKFFVFALLLSLISPFGFANDTDVAPNVNAMTNLINNTSPSPFSMGDVNWSLDVGTPTKDASLVGVEFDGANYWLTGANSLTQSGLYEVSPTGVLINSYLQPATHWGGWGWRDLAYDGTYLYAGDPNSGFIQQIDTSTGAPTGVTYGPFPQTPCRALAYDKNTDSFWTANFTSDINQCFRTGTFNTFSNPGLSCYGAAIEEQTGAPMLWMWSQDGLAANLNTGTQFDMTGNPTGLAFVGDPAFGGMAGGACANELTNGEWEIVGLHQTNVDAIVAYDIYPLIDPLEIDNKDIKSWVGGTVNFTLDAGVVNAGRQYLLLGSISYIPGVSAGIPLKAGAVLPLAWDSFTTMLLNINMPSGHFGVLGANGDATASLILPTFDPPFDFNMTFAYALRPLNYASNYQQVSIKDWATPTIYKYDDGVGDNLTSWTNGGEICFMHAFDCGPGGDTIEKVSNIYGSVLYAGNGVGNGHTTTIFIWDDPTNDSEPSDCSLLDMVSSTVQNEDQGIFVDTTLTAPKNVSGIFFVGVMMDHAGSTGGEYVVPMDETNKSLGNVWLGGDPGNLVGGFDYTILSNNASLNSITDAVWLLRAIPQ